MARLRTDGNRRQASRPAVRPSRPDRPHPLRARPRPRTPPTQVRGGRTLWCLARPAAAGRSQFQRRPDVVAEPRQGHRHHQRVIHHRRPRRRTLHRTRRHRRLPPDLRRRPRRADPHRPEPGPHRMSDLPPGWSHATIGDLLLRIEAGKSFRCETRPASLSEWGIIKVSAMTWGAFREDENKAVPAGVDFNPDYEIKPGDILVSRANTEEYVGAPVMVDGCRSHLLLSDKSLRLVASDHLNSRWLYYMLSSPT